MKLPTVVFQIIILSFSFLLGFEAPAVPNSTTKVINFQQNPFLLNVNGQRSNNKVSLFSSNGSRNKRSTKKSTKWRLEGDVISINIINLC